MTETTLLRNQFTISDALNPLVRFNGDIIITDPGYVIKSEDWNGGNYDKEYFGTHIARSNGCGDWNCITVDTDSNTVLGQFSSETGMVGVFLLDEVLKYNPTFDKHLTQPETTTLIKSFTGNIGFVVHTNDVYVVGDGTTKFQTQQTEQ
jgi:hypothetical protein